MNVIVEVEPRDPVKKKINRLEKKYTEAMMKGCPVRAKRVMRSYANFVRKPVRVIVKGFRPKKINTIGGMENA